MLALSLVTPVSGLDSIVKRYLEVQVVKLLVLVCEYGFDLVECPGIYLPFIHCYHLICNRYLGNCKKCFLTFGNRIIQKKRLVS